MCFPIWRADERMDADAAHIAVAVFVGAIIGANGK